MQGRQGHHGQEHEGQREPEPASLGPADAERRRQDQEGRERQGPQEPEEGPESGPREGLIAHHAAEGIGQEELVEEVPVRLQVDEVPGACDQGRRQDRAAEVDERLPAPLRDEQQAYGGRTEIDQRRLLREGGESQDQAGREHRNRPFQSLRGGEEGQPHRRPRQQGKVRGEQARTQKGQWRGHQEERREPSHSPPVNPPAQREPRRSEDQEEQLERRQRRARGAGRHAILQEDRGPVDEGRVSEALEQVGLQRPVARGEIGLQDPREQLGSDEVRGLVTPGQRRCPHQPERVEGRRDGPQDQGERPLPGSR